MRSELQSRLRTLEAKALQQMRSPKAMLPVWLMESLRRQGIRVGSSRPLEIHIPRSDMEPASFL